MVREGEPIAISALPGKVTGFPLQAGDRVVSLSAGGGGFGDSDERPQDAVRRDLAAGYISAETAGFPPQAGVARRAETRARCKLVAGATSGLERFTVSPDLAEVIGLGGGAVVEVLEAVGAPLRGILALDEALPPGVVGVSELALRVLRCAAGSSLRIRGVGGP